MLLIKIESHYIIIKKTITIMLNKGLSLSSYHNENKAKLYRNTDENINEKGYLYENGAHFKYMTLFNRLVELIQTLPISRLGNNGVYFQESDCQIIKSINIKPGPIVSNYMGLVNRKKNKSSQRKVYFNDSSSSYTSSNSVFASKENRRDSNSSISSIKTTIKTKENMSLVQSKNSAFTHIVLPELKLNMKNRNVLLLQRQSNGLNRSNINKQKVISRKGITHKKSLITFKPLFYKTCGGKMNLSPRNKPKRVVF